MKLLMISGKGAAELAGGKRGAFFATLEELRMYFDRIDILAPRVPGVRGTHHVFDNVFVHVSPRSLFMQSRWISRKGSELHALHQYDAMTVNDYAPFYNGHGALRLHRRTAMPFCLELHHITGVPKASGIKERLYRMMGRRFIPRIARKAKIIRVVNQTQVPDYLKQIGVSADMISYIPSMYIDFDTFKPISIEKKYDVAFVGRFAKNKGLDVLLKALSKNNARAIFVGDGPEKNAVASMIQKYGLTERVTLHGWAKDAHEINELLNQSRMLVMPSYSEGGPRVVFEAMAAGIPVISTRVGLVIDEVHDHENGLIVDWSAQSIAKAIDELLNNTELSKKLAENGKQTVQKFERKTAIRNYADSLKKLI